jgi:hypothetical protein
MNPLTSRLARSFFSATCRRGSRNEKRRDSTESRRRRTTKKLMKKSLLLLLRGGLLGCGLLRGLLLSCHFYLPPSPMMRTRGSLTPRVASQSLTDKDFATLAAVCNDTLTRVGSVASVVATTSSIAIQCVVYLNEPSHVNGSRKIFFASRSENFLDVGR